jgi:hypothetical protein
LFSGSVPTAVCEFASVDFGEVVEWARAHFLFGRSAISLQPNERIDGIQGGFAER